MKKILFIIILFMTGISVNALNVDKYTDLEYELLYEYMIDEEF